MKVHAALNAASDSRRVTKRPAASSANRSDSSGSSVRGSDSEVSASGSDDASEVTDSDVSDSDPEILDALFDPADSESEGEEEVELDLAALHNADRQQMQRKAQALRAQMK